MQEPSACGTLPPMSGRSNDRFEATSVRKWARRAGKGSWAVLDQGSFALSHFALNVLLARWLSPEEYGIFTVSYAVFLLVGSVHSGLFSEPLVVFGSGKYSENNSRYIGALIYGHLLFSIAAGALLVTGGLAVAGQGSEQASVVSLVIALSMPFMLLQWLVRHACYARSEPRLAAISGVTYMVLIIGGAMLMQSREWLSAPSAIALMGAASLLVSVLLAGRLGVRLPALRETVFLAEVFTDHWQYGRWAVPTRVLTYIPSNAFYIVLPAWGGVAASGALKALMNMVMPALQAYAALSTLLTGALTRARGTPEFGHLVKVGLGLFIVAAVLYWAVLGAARDSILSLFYDGQYAEYADLLWALGLLPIAAAALAILTAGLRALLRPDLIFWAYVWTTVSTISVGLAAVALWSIDGAVAGLLIGSVVTTLSMAILYLKTRTRS